MALRPDVAAERLQKVLAHAGVASRRHAEQVITAGRVSVNGQVVTALGTKVDPQVDRIAVDGKPLAVQSVKRWFILYKPEGMVTTLSDPRGRASVGELIKQQKLEGRVYPVGRLDYDAEGALLLTDDGELAHQLLHPSFGVKRTYLAKVKGVPSKPSLDKLLEGVRLEDGMAKALSVEAFEQTEKNTWLELSVGEGRPHIVKRLLAAIGHPVVRLFRPQHAGITVEALEPGQLRPLTDDEVERIRRIAQGEPAPASPRALPGRRHRKEGPASEDDEAASGRPPRESR